MLWIKSLHIIFMVTWFSGLFYLPRLYVYHAMSNDQVSLDRFKIMERKLYFGITTPGMLGTLVFGIWLLSYNLQGYLHAPWMHFKLTLVALLIVYHVYLGKLYCAFKHDRNQHGHVFYRILNEVPVLFLAIIVILVVVKP
jgi:protoporphyrinogen IX oxidase